MQVEPRPAPPPPAPPETLELEGAGLEVFRTEHGARVGETRWRARASGPPAARRAALVLRAVYPDGGRSVEVDQR